MSHFVQQMGFPGAILISSEVLTKGVTVMPSIWSPLLKVLPLFRSLPLKLSYFENTLQAGEV